MILDKKPLTIIKVLDYVKDSEGKEDLIKYLKKFGKISKEKADKIFDGINALNNPKIRESHIVKMIDFAPKDHEDINKILMEANINEEEANALLEIIKG